ncbi:hypothetical protein Tco_0953212 [Tanacetum coccineum]|uniref:Uncharacterized protein n=1 Tax=Tanacetum coccineum TaxID=301880 RepID=A0ABQ5DZX9_9ASTR
MCSYLKNMEGNKLKDLKNKYFDSIQKMFDKAFNRVNTFVDFRTDLVEGSSKRAGEELEQESTKKQKVDEDKDTSDLESLMEVIPDEEEVAIDVVPLAAKSPKIVDWKIHKEGKNSYHQIVRADGKSQIPMEIMDYLLWNDLKTMFEPHIEDAIWRNQQGYKVLEWKLYDSCGYKVNAAKGVNAAEEVDAASEEVSTAELLSKDPWLKRTTLRGVIGRPPLIEPNGFCFWKARFETFVKSKDIDLWQVIQNDDFYFKDEDKETKLMKVTPYELLKDNGKKPLGKINEAKVTREQTSDDRDSQGGSDEDINEEDVEAFNLLARNFCKVNRFGCKN